MKKVISTTSFAIILIGIMTGCTSQSDCTVISSKIVRLNDFELDKADRKPAKGEDVSRIIFFFPTKASPTLKEALDKALENGDGDVMTDARVKFWSWYIPCIYGETGWSAEGTVVKTRK